MSSNNAFWASTQDKRIEVFGFNEADCFLFTFTGWGRSGAAKKVAEQLAAGADPRTIKSPTPTVVPLGSIQSVDFRQDESKLRVSYLDPKSNRPKSLAFVAANNADCRSASTYLAEYAAKIGGKAVESGEAEVSAWSMLWPPLLTTVVLAGIVYAAYLAAVELEAGKEVEVSGRRQGLKQLVVTVADALGTNGILAVGGLVVALGIAWMVYSVTHKAKRTILTLVASPNASGAGDGGAAGGMLKSS